MNKKETKKNKLDKKALIISIVVAVIVLVVAVVLALVNMAPKIEDGYFVSDDSKLVVSMDKKMASFVEGEYEPDYTRIVYYYNGNNITGAKIFFEYEDEESAKLANENISVGELDWAIDKTLNGKYIVLQVKSSEYNGMTTEEVRSNIRQMEKAGVAL
ncbi:hypothetical protein IJG04_01055 [Candidatus Saccharibacteria bacterium]|nr:hypothetical protein [Candidatus Saccharibacteria bacterium]